MAEPTDDDDCLRYELSAFEERTAEVMQALGIAQPERHFTIPMTDLQPARIEALREEIHEGGSKDRNRFTQFSSVAGGYIAQARKGEITLEVAYAMTLGWMQLMMIPPWPEQRARTEFQALVRLDTINHPQPARPPSPASKPVIAATFPSAEDDAPRQWPAKPQPLPDVPPVPSMSLDMVPEPFRPWLGDAAERMCVPLELVAVPALVAFGIVVGRGLGILPKRKDDWLVACNLWGAVVGRPGIMKSAVISEGIRPLSRLVAKAHEEWKKTDLVLRIDYEMLHAKKARSRDTLKSKSAKADALEKAKNDLEEALKGLDDLAKRVERRYMTQDPTVEKLGELLIPNPRGLGLVRDELAGWIAAFDRQGRENDRAFYLEAWNGTGGTYTYDRIVRGTLHIPSPCVSILGGMVPAKLRALQRESMGDVTRGDGLLQRFQLLVWPDAMGNWRNVDRWPDSAARNRAFAIFERAASFDLPAHVGAQSEDGAIPALRFDSVAQERFDAWRSDLEMRLRSHELEQTPAYESHVAKYRSLAPKLALLFHLIDMLDGRAITPAVSDEALALALAWCAFLDAHARKVYAPELQASDEAARLLAARIDAGAVVDGMTVHDIKRADWSGLARGDVVQLAIERLTALGWVRTEQLVTGGRPSVVIRLHPVFPVCAP
jgi:putative DNA primase/helicase